MSRHILGLLISALLLVQISNAVPVPQQELRDYAFVESAKLLKDILVEGTHIFDNIKEKAATIEPKSAELSDYLEKFDQFSVRLTELNSTELTPKTALTIMQFFDSFLQILDRYKREHFPAELALQRNGLEPYSVYYEISFQKFSNELIAHFDRYIADLSNEDKEKEAKLVNGFETFKAMGTYRRIKDLFGLLDLFDNKDLEA